MSKFTKFLSSLLGIVLLTVLASVVFTYQYDATLPTSVEHLRWSPHLNDSWQSHLATYLFWAAIIFMIVIVIVLFTLLFYPRTRTEFKLADGGGELHLKKSAIEGLVKTVVQANDYMKNPRVSSKLYKRKFKVAVRGEVIPRVEVAAKTKALEDEIRLALQEFLGMNQELKFRVEVSNVSKQVKPTGNRVD